VLIRGSGVDLNTFVPAEEPSGPVTVVLASRLLGDKGVREFVGAARQLHARGIKGRFVLVGDVDPGNPTSLTSSEIRSWEYDGTIEWWGHRDDMSQVFADCHLVCLPSYQEGLPKVLIEAAAAGRPIVTTDVPGCREVVQHGETGFLVPPRTVSPLASALEQLMLDQALRARFGARAREGSVQFDLQTVIADTLALYQTVAPGEPRVSD
jgi:glycosyltransferase involved in cell wall biosynthesis